MMDDSRTVFFFPSGGMEGYDVAETAARLIGLVPKMTTHAELAEVARFDLPINAGAKLRR